jgi:hypothetical protein
MKNSSDTIGNRTRDLPACSTVPQPTAPPRTPHIGQEEIITYPDMLMMMYSVVNCCAVGDKKISYNSTSCCIVDGNIIFLFYSFLQDCGMHCYVGHMPSITQYLFTLFLVSRPGMVTLTVYRVSHVCCNVRDSSYFVLELVGVCRAPRHGRGVSE